jgi:corrinoid protein of di/trimethylamine methyltransferase
LNLEKISKAIIDLEEDRVQRLVKEALEEKVPARSILELGLIPGMKEVGRLFSIQQFFVPEVLIAADAFYAGFAIISPLLKENPAPSRGKVVIGVVQGDIHDIGKNIVKVMLEASGFEVIDLGKDVPNEKFIETVASAKPDILALSSLMTTTMVQMETIIKKLTKAKLRKTVRVIVGGAPLDRNFAEKIGADAYGADATQAVKIAEELVVK